MLRQLGIDLTSSKPQEQPKKPPRKHILFEELHADNFEANCIEGDGLCVIALLNPAEDNTDRIQVLRDLHEKRSSGYSYSWVSASCHPNFLAQFQVDEFALPTVVAVSPKKGAFTKFVGKFDATDIARFVRGVMRGRGNIQELPGGQLDSPDLGTEACAHVVADMVDDSDSGEDDVDLEEFLRETAAEQEAEDAAAAATAAEAEANKDPCDDANLNEWGQKECRAKAARQRELDLEKQRLVG